MKTIQKTKSLALMVLMTLMMMSAPLQAQVKIGQDSVPKKGTVLELNSSSEGYIGGLRLPNVWITDINVIPAAFSENDLDTVEKDSLAGAIIYNTNDKLKNDKGEETGIGVYYWTGSKWIKETSGAIEPWYKVGTSGPSTQNTDDSYLMAKVAIGAKTPANLIYGDAQLTVAGDASINGITAGRGKGNKDNFVFGRYALYNNTTGTQNVAIGEYSLQYNTTGEENVAIGHNSLMMNTTGSINTAIGFQSLYENKTGSGNVAIGNRASQYGSSGNNNIAIGEQTLVMNSGGSRGDNNIAMGYKAIGYNYLSGSGNIGIGFEALYQGGYSNVGIGFQALKTSLSNTSSGNVAIGFQTMGSGNPEGYNTAIGYQALYGGGGTGNTAIGNGALWTAYSTATYNTAIGYNAGRGITNGSNNIAIGTNSQVRDNYGGHQLAIGQFIYGQNGDGIATAKVGIGTNNPTTKLHLQAGAPYEGFRLVDGNQGEGKVLTSDNEGNATWEDPQTGGGTAIEPWYQIANPGSQSIENTDDSYLMAKVAIGTNKSQKLYDYMGSSGGGVPNEDFYKDMIAQLTVVGGDISVNEITVGTGRGRHNSNTIVGYQALRNNFPVTWEDSDPSMWFGANNTAIGSMALNKNEKGNCNVAVGSDAISNNSEGKFNTSVGVMSGQTMESGSKNTILGYKAGDKLKVGDNNIIIGANANVDPNEPDVENEGDWLPVNNQLVIGKFIFGVDGNSQTNAKVGIGTNNPQTKLDILAGDSYTGFKLMDSSVAAAQDGWVLTTDGTGAATWRESQGGRTTVVNEDVPIKVAKSTSETTDTYTVGISAGENVGDVLTTTIIEGNKTTVWQAPAATGPWYRADVNDDGHIDPTDFSEIRSGIGYPATDNTKAAYLSAKVIIGENIKEIYECTEDEEEGNCYKFARGAACELLIDYADIQNPESFTQLYVGGDAKIAGHTFGRGGGYIKNNLAIGYETLFRNISGKNNTAIGYGALSRNTGDSNTALGSSAGNALTDGSYNTTLGSGAGDNITTGSYNIAIGYQSRVGNPTDDGQINIGNLIYATGATGTYTQGLGSVGIGILAPEAKLHVAGSFKVDGDAHCAAGIWASSDERWKKDIVTISDPISIIEQLRGTSYKFRTDEFPNKGFNEGTQLGVIAQEVEKVLPELVKEDSEGFKSVNYDGLIPVLIEGLKAQQTQIELLLKINEQLEARLTALETK
ncbi:MAG: tail fiber domain-containing protein [Dysgonamonadaceae bacterium]|nr:tail fiber domain-containing protein [Dysgonamonadaceae bacterium]